MNYIDMFILVLLVYAVFRGITRGFIMQLASVTALIFGIYVAMKFSGFTASHLAKLLSVSREFLYLISLGVTFILVFLLIHMLGRILEKIIESVDLSLINKAFGVFFSLAKTVLIVGVLLVYIERIDRRVPFLPEGSREHSLFFRPFTSIIHTIFPTFGVSKVPENEKNNEMV
jgi:membrane protein required for colicin V production